jgi:hypothetical protein
MEDDFEKTLEILREAHREAIPEAHYAAVRARVLAQLAMERKPWWRRIWVYGFAAAAVMLMAVIVMATFWPKPAPQPFVAQQTPAPSVRPQDETPPVPAPVAHNRRPRLPGRPAVYRVVGPPVPQPLVVKLLTNDPDVVIYWFSGE